VAAIAASYVCVTKASAAQRGENVAAAKWHESIKQSEA